MRTVASFIFISLDGFHEGPNGELGWPNDNAEFEDFAVHQLDDADTLDAWWRGHRTRRKHQSHSWKGPADHRQRPPDRRTPDCRRGQTSYGS